MIYFLVVFYYLTASSVGLILIKLFMLEIDLSLIPANKRLLLDWRIILGSFLYMSSFLTWFYIISKNELSFIYPIIVGLGYVFIAVLSITLLNEVPNVYRYVGIILILLGVIIMSLNGR